MRLSPLALDRHPRRLQGFEERPQREAVSKILPTTRKQIVPTRGVVNCVAMLKLFSGLHPCMYYPN